MNKDFVMMFEEFDNSLYEEDINQEGSIEQPIDQSTEQPIDQPIDQSTDPQADDIDPTNTNVNSATDAMQIESNYKKTVAELSPLITDRYPNAYIGKLISGIGASVAKIYVNIMMKNKNTNPAQAATIAVKETMRRKQSEMSFLTLQHIIDIAKYSYTGLGHKIFPDKRQQYIKDVKYVKALNYIEKHPDVVKTI